jgi:hypothetical protein
MPPTLILALFFTVALLVTTGYFILGSVPLLVLEHDTPLDSRFVRGFFNLYYQAAIFTSSAAALSYALAAKFAFAAGAAALALLAVLLRRKVIPYMEALGTQIESAGPEAIRRFRRMHVLAIVINLVQLAIIVAGLLAYSMK